MPRSGEAAPVINPSAPLMIRALPGLEMAPQEEGLPTAAKVMGAAPPQEMKAMREEVTPAHNPLPPFVCQEARLKGQHT